MKKTAWGLATMLYMGAVAFLVLGALVAARMGRPVRVEALEAADVQAASIVRGLWSSVHEARIGLAMGNRSDAAHALDAAMRSSEVLSHATGERQGVFHRTHQSVMRARHQLQIGQPADALDVLSAAAHRLDEAEPDLPAPTGGPTPEDADDYEGAVLINAQGVRVGEVVEMRGLDQVVLAIGGARDVLGLFDAGRSDYVAVPPDSLIFGKTKGLGATMVMVPRIESGPRLAAELRAAPAPGDERPAKP